MRLTPIMKDNHGREAFSYLAVMLLILTSFFVSYQVSYERQRDRGLKNNSLLSDLTGELTSVKWSIGQELIRIHDEIMVEAEVDVSEGPGDLRLDGLIEGKMVAHLELELEDIAVSHMKKDANLGLKVLDWSVDSRPLIGGLEIPVPGTSMDRNLSGLTETCIGPEVFGVNTTIWLEMEIIDEGNMLRVRDRLDLSIGRLSLAGYMSGRLERFQDALDGIELASLIEYMAGSLIQMKCMMGYGREPVSGEIAPVSIVTEKELLAVMDLGISLISSSHLGCVDNGLIDMAGDVLGSAPGAIGRSMTGPLLSNSSDLIDPGMLVVLGEGIFHHDNPPSLQTMLRPLFLHMTDLIINRLVSYIGLEDEMLMRVGGFKALFDLGVEAADSLTESLLGLDIIDTSHETASGMFEALLKRSDLLDPEEDCIMIGAEEGAYWNNSPISGYPPIQIPRMERTFEFGLSDGGPENKYYRSSNGTIHTKAEYFNPDDEFIGASCTVYSVGSAFEFQPMEPPFFSRNLLMDDDFIAALAYFLGTEEGNDLQTPESVFREKGRFAIRKVIDDMFGDLTGSCNEDWERLWVGWDMDSLPSMMDDFPSMGSMVNVELWPLMELAGSFTEALIDEFTSVGLLDTLVDVERGYSSLVSDWIMTNYDTWCHRGEQMDGCDEERIRILFENCTVELLDIEILEENVIYSGPYLETGREDTTVFETYPEFSKWFGLGLAEKMVMDPELYVLWAEGVVSSYNEVMEREFDNGGTSRQEGWIRRELSVADTRGIDLLFSSYKGSVSSLSDHIGSYLGASLDRIAGSFDRVTRLSGNRFIVPVPDSGGPVKVAWPGGSEGPFDDLSTEVIITRGPASWASIMPLDGEYQTVPFNLSAPYRTRYSLVFKSDYHVEYLSKVPKNDLGSIRTLHCRIDLTVPIVVDSYWPMLGIEYRKIGTLREHLLDKVAEARSRLKEEMNDLLEDILGGTMSSLREVPPIVMDIVRSRDLDPVEIARVVSNVTMDLSSTVRETVTGLIKKIIDMGLTGVLDIACSILGLDEIDLEIDLGSFRAALHTERRALTGGAGTLLNITFDLPPIGMHCYMSFNRLKDEEFDFNGTVTFDLGLLRIRLELDPFMMRAPNMVSIEVRHEGKDGNVIGASFECPSLEEYRSCEVSLGDTLGVEPFIPVPPLGIQAVIDAGLRLNYRMPEELGPRLNEVEVTGFNITRIEIYDPRKFPIYGSTVNMVSPDGLTMAIWRLEPEVDVYLLNGLDRDSLWKWSARIPDDGLVLLVLRSSSGSVLDEVEVDLSRDGWLSRDADGFGVWRSSKGTPGYGNGGSLPTDIRSLLVSIALSSLKEAWKESFAAYGLCFDVIAPFLERAIDLFMERFLSLVRELVTDVRLFLAIEIEDASGSAGGGLEMSFQADGEAVAGFLGWLYENIKVFILNIADPQNAGNYREFPWEILNRCYIGLDLFMEVEMPGPVAKMAPDSANLPDSFTLAVMAKVNLALPISLLGKDVGGFVISLGVYIKDAPDSIVSLFYDIDDIGLTRDFYLMKATIWEESN
ncbi:MAG: hypothetical protein ACMUHY_01140 [Thermoplasmatota archaeon]